MAVLLNQASNLRLRLDLLARTSDGVHAPAALTLQAALERYQKPAFVPLVQLEAPLLDLDLIGFLQSLEALLDGAAPEAALDASRAPSLALRLTGGPEAFQVEAGVDLLSVLHPVAGVTGEPGENLALFRFLANKRAALAFCAQLLAEFARFPTDPSKVHPGTPG